MPTGPEYKQQMINALNENTGFTPEEKLDLKMNHFLYPVIITKITIMFYQMYDLII